MIRSLPNPLLFALGAALLTFAACGPDDRTSELGSSVQPLFDNGGFEVDGGSLSSWTINTYLNSTGVNFPPQTVADLNLAAGGTVLTFARTNPVPESQVFAGMTSAPGIPHWPKFDTTSAVINETNGLNSTNVNALRQHYTVTYADVDPGDGKVHVRFVLAPALQAAGHAPAQQPYFFVNLANLTTGATLYTTYNYSNNPGVPWQVQGTGATAVLYTDWTIFDIVPGNTALAVGDTLELAVYASRCQPSGHFGEVYVDGFGANLGGLTIAKTAVQATGVDSDLTYNFTVENNSSAVANGVVANETLPFGTTFVSVSTTWPGATCTSPAVGGTGVVSCTLGQLNPGAMATFQVKVHAFGVAPNGSGTASAGGAATLTDASKAWAVNGFSGYSVYLTGGQGVGQLRTVLTNTATQLTVGPNWTTAPNNTTAYKIVDPPIDTGTVSARTNNTLTDGNKAWTVGSFIARTVTITSGTGAGQQRTIIDNTATALTVSPNWTTQPGVNATYAIGLAPDQVVNGNYSVQSATTSPLLGPKVSTSITAGVTYTDLAVTVSDGQPAVAPGSPVSYTITVTNNGPTAVNGASVTDTLPAQVTGGSWTCVATGGATCGAASGNGSLASTANIPVGGTVTYTLTGTVANNATGTLTDVANVSPPSGVSDSDSRNNSDADQDQVGTLFPLQVSKNLTDTGLGTVTSSPIAISCGTGCTSASASFTSTTTVVLTAVARPGDTFTGWEGDCTGTATTCSVAMSAARSVTARFRGYLVTGAPGTGGTVTCTPASVAQGGSSTCTVTPDADHVVSSVSDNGTNVTGSMSNGSYSLTNISQDHTVSATFDRKPDFTTSGPTGAGVGVPFSYPAGATDTDGPGPLSWSRDPADTCGGSVSATGTYAFTPAANAPDTCVMAIDVCDANMPPACRSQLTTVTINHPPVANPDQASTSPNTPVNVNGSALTANDTPGPSSESGQTLTVTGVSATSANGGTVTLSNGVVTYTPPAGFTGTDTFTYTVTDSGNPAESSTGTVTVTVTNAAPVITSTAPANATEGTPYTYAATETDPDGPQQNWSVGTGDTCGGTIDATGHYTFTPAGPTPPASCVMVVQVCDGGVPDQCATQSTTIAITAVDSPPVITSTAPTTATAGTAYSYPAAETDPDGPQQNWSVGAGDTCGGTVSATGTYSFTPPANAPPPATCVVSVKVCDGATPDSCATQATTVTIGAGDVAPVITSTAPTTATAGSAYSYAATETDTDGPQQNWSLGPDDTCGGTVSATGTYSFTPPANAPPPATCVVSVKVCDGGTPDRCATQDTTVTVNPKGSNQPPSFSTTPPGRATAGTPFSYTPQASDPEGTALTYSRGDGDTCGGSVDASSGTYTFTPGAPPPDSCVLAVKACDSGSPPQCTTQTGTVTISSTATPGFAPGVGVAGGGCGCSEGPGAAGLAMALLALAAIRRPRAKVTARRS